MKLLSLVVAAFVVNNLPAATIDIDGSLSEFADYSTQSANTVWGPSSQTEGNMTLSVLNNSPIIIPPSASPGLTWNTGWSSGSYATGAEINFNQGESDNPSAANAISLGKFLSIELSTTGPRFDWDTISVDLWRNGAGAARFYQFAYAADGIYDTGDLLGAATDVSLTGASNVATVSFAGLPIISNTAGDQIRLYFWGGTNDLGNTHLVDVSADFTVVPEPRLSVLIMAGAVAIQLLRRRTCVANS